MLVEVAMVFRLSLCYHIHQFQPAERADLIMKPAENNYGLVFSFIFWVPMHLLIYTFSCVI